MNRKLPCVLALLTIPAFADPALFDWIHLKQDAVLVLPDGTCDAKVVGRRAGQLTAKLKNTTRVCGRRNTLVTVSRADVLDVADRRLTGRQPGTSRAGWCFGLALALIGQPAALYVGEGLHSDVGALAVFAASAVAGGMLCRDRTPRYVIVTERVAPERP